MTHLAPSPGLAVRTRRLTRWALLAAGIVGAAAAPAQGPPPLEWTGPGHIGIDDLAVSADGKLFATAGVADRTVKVWEMASGKLLHTLAGHEEALNAIALSLDGRLLASCGGFSLASQAPSVMLWDVESGEQALKVEGTSDDCHAVALAPSGKLLAAGNGDDILVLRTDTGELVRRLSGHAGRIHDLAFTPSSLLLASASGDGTIKVWAVGEDKPPLTLSGHSGAVTSVAFSPGGGEALASGGTDSTVRLWDPTNGEPRLVMQGHVGAVRTVGFTPDAGFVASGGDDRSLRLWRVRDGLPEQVIDEAHAGPVVGLGFLPDAESVMSVGGDSRVRRWEFPEETMLAELGNHFGPVYDVALSPDEERLASAGGAGFVYLWSTKTGDVELRLEAHQDAVNAVAFAPDRRLMATGAGAQPPNTRDGGIRIWDLDTGKPTLELPGHPGGTTDLLFTRDGLSLISAGRDNFIRFWSVRDGSNYRTLTGHKDWVRALALSQDGLLLASGGRDAVVNLWSVKDGNLQRVMITPQPIAALAFSSDDAALASAEEGTGKTVRVWDPATGGVLLAIAPEPAGAIDSIAFSPLDGTLVGGSGQSHTIQVWDARDGHAIRTYDRETSWGLFPSMPLVFAGDGRLAYGRGDATVALANASITAEPTKGELLTDGFDGGDLSAWH